MFPPEMSRVQIKKKNYNEDPKLYRLPCFGTTVPYTEKETHKSREVHEPASPKWILIRGPKPPHKMADVFINMPICLCLQ